MDNPLTATIETGYGYYDTTHYPLGGKFVRAVADVPVTIKRDLRAEGHSPSRCHGCTHTGVTADGASVAFNYEQTTIEGRAERKAALAKLFSDEVSNG